MCLECTYNKHYKRTTKMKLYANKDASELRSALKGAMKF